ncbi:MAG: extracellular solute-binding protein, partial [Sulfuritalea sp.]|nr:extracellular solute-binding protein [Sulfuritalea sp.]
MKRSLTGLAACALLLAPLAAAAAQPRPAKAPPPAPVQEIVLRHTLAGAPLDALATLVLRFNDEEGKRRSGAGRIRLEDARGVADRGRLPNLALFNPDDALDVFGMRPRFRALHQVMAAGGQAFEAKRFYPQMLDAVADGAGRMQALPLALSLPALYYNKAALARAGLDPESPPTTWWEVQEAAGKLRDSGVHCPLTSSRFAWVHVENVAAQHGEPIVTRNGKTDRLALNNLVNVKHMALLTSWKKSRYFSYSGAGEEGDERFARGECAMLTGESALYVRLARQRPEFEFGVAPLPHYDDVYGVRPTHVLPDGAALWVLAADRRVEQQAIARFVAFL